jgi:hypothetical protein
MTGEGPIGQAASADVPGLSPGVRRRARRLAWAYLIVAVWLAVWTLFLALSLPKDRTDFENSDRGFNANRTEGQL